MKASEFKLKMLREDVSREQTAVNLGWGDPAKLVAMKVELEALANAIQERRVREWEAFKQANARVFPERTVPAIAQDNPMWCLLPMGMDETRYEAQERFNGGKYGWKA